MSTPDFVAFLLCQADIAGSTDWGDVYREAAGRLAGLDAECGRLRGVLAAVQRNMIGVPLEDRVDAWNGVVRALNDAG